MQKWGESLRPISKAAKEEFAKVPDREIVNVDVMTRRSKAQSDLYWSILGKIAPHLDGIGNKDKLHLALKLALGKYDLMEIKGKAVPVPQSMSKWSQKIQGAYFDEAVDLICRDLLPKVGSDDLTGEIIGMLAPKADAA
jgi:hypothetical protein